ncbi:MAG: glycosyltransferase [Thermoguttaceae bacterium]
MERSLTVLLPVHNHQSVLAGQVQRILDVLPDLTRQFELIIIDDGSTDATIEVADELAKRYPQIRVAHHAVPQGRLASLRTGLQKSTGDVILLHDEGSGLSIKEVQTRWHVMRESALARRPSDAASRNASSLWPETPTEESYQMIDRQAMRVILDQADTPTGREYSAGGASRPRRPNYMARLREFALGE